MSLLPGVYIARKKDGSQYYRSSITYRRKHISLGSYSTEIEAYQTYRTALTVVNTPSITIDDYQYKTHTINFTKWIVLINFRDHGIYFKTPIYLKKNYFLYYLTPDHVLKFDVDDLFYYSHHSIMQRGGYLFVADFGMQMNIQSRYGIKNFAVKGRDYLFINGDDTDYRYGNIQIINRYYGVFKMQHGLIYEARIHINGDYIIGKYKSEIEAAVAYNKAVMLLKEKEPLKNYQMNYIVELDEISYASLLNKVRISNKIRLCIEKGRISTIENQL